MEIVLKNNKVALVDEKDYAQLIKHSWYELNGYAARVKDKKIIYMHREILQPDKGLLTDHINRNKLDNRRLNLRAVKRGLSQYNQRKRSNASGVRGVGLHMGRWRATIGHKGKQVYLGHFDSKEQAVNARLRAERIYY